MKHFYPTLSFRTALTTVVMTISSLLLQAQCPTGSTSNTAGTYTNGQTVCISAAFSGDIKLNNGAKMVIVSGGRFTGTLEANPGSAIEVRLGGEFSPGQTNTFSGTLTNEGTVKMGTSTFNIKNGASITNNATLSVEGNWNQGGSITFTNNACGTMDVKTSVSLNNNGTTFINNGKLNFLQDLSVSSGTTLNNRGQIYVKGNLTSNGRIYNQWKMVLLGNNNMNADSVVNLYVMIFKNGGNWNVKIRNEGLLSVGGPLTFNSGAALIMNNTGAQTRINGAFSNNTTVTGAGMLYVAGAVGNNNTIKGISSAKKLQVNATPNGTTSNLQLNTSMIAYDTTSYYMGWGNPELCNTLLPVELSPLQAVYKNNASLLSWSTSMENNTQAFIIEYSRNGVDFTTAGQVAAAGYSNSKRNYTFTHNITASGTLYYRLRSVDTDGRTTYSNIASVKTNGTQTFTTSTYPNPFTESLNVNLTLDKAAPVTVTIYDANGRMIQKVVRQGKPGSNQVTVSGLSALLPGVYVASIVAGEQKTVEKLVK